MKFDFLWPVSCKANFLSPGEKSKIVKYFACRKTDEIIVQNDETSNNKYLEKKMRVFCVDKWNTGCYNLGIHRGEPLFYVVYCMIHIPMKTGFVV